MTQHGKKRGHHEQHHCPQRGLPQKTSVCNKEGLASPTTFGKNPLVSFHDGALETTSYTAGASLHHALEKPREQSQPSPGALPAPAAPACAHGELSPAKPHSRARGAPPAAGHPTQRDLQSRTGAPGAAAAALTCASTALLRTAGARLGRCLTRWTRFLGMRIFLRACGKTNCRKENSKTGSLGSSTGSPEVNSLKIAIFHPAASHQNVSKTDRK